MISLPFLAWEIPTPVLFFFFFSSSKTCAHVVLFVGAVFEPRFHEDIHQFITIRFRKQVLACVEQRSAQVVFGPRLPGSGDTVSSPACTPHAFLVARGQIRGRPDRNRCARAETHSWLRAKIVAMATTRLLRSSGIQRREVRVHVGGENEMRICFVFNVRRVLCRSDEFPQGARCAAFQLLSSPCEAM